MIPKSVTTIEEFAFDLVALTDVYYEGTKEEWNAIVIEEYEYNPFSPEYITDLSFHYNYVYE